MKIIRAAGVRGFSGLFVNKAATLGRVIHQAK